MKFDQFFSLKRVAVFSAAAWLSSPLCATEKQVVDLEADIAALKEKLAETGSLGDEIVKLTANIESAEKEIAAAKAEASAKETELAGKEYLLGIYQGAYRITTTLAPGENLGAMTLKNGEGVDPSSFVSIGNGSVLVQTATGSRSIPLGMLPDSLAGRISMPPPVEPLSTTVAAVRAGKPDSIKSTEEKSSSEAPPAPMAAAPPEAKPSSAPVPANDAESVRKRNNERLLEITHLKTRFSELFTQKKIARQEKADAEKRFREARIKRSQAEITSTMKMHNDKISAIEQEEASIRAKIATLQAQME